MVPRKDKKNFKKRKFNRLIPKDVTYIDYKNIELLNSCINNQGKIISRISSGLNAKQQRLLARAIKRARQMALIPYIKERIRK